MKEEKVRLLFVCLGNICRSPSAEAVMKKLVKDAGLGDRIEIDSAGITGYHEGDRGDSRMQEKKPIRVCARMRPVGDIRWIRSPVRYVSGTFMTSI